MYYCYGVGKGKSKVRGAPQMNSGYEGECYMEGCRGVVVMRRPRDPKTFHKNRKLNLLFILIFERQVCQKREKAVPRFLIKSLFIHLI